MSDDQTLKATLTSFYETIGSHKFDAIPKYLTPSMTVVTSFGSQNVKESQQISDLYRNLWTTWSARGDKCRNRVLRRPVRRATGESQLQTGETQLTNFKFKGNQLQT